METERGGPVSRGDVWIATHKKSNGLAINAKAKDVIDKILSYESSGNSSHEVPQFDSLAMALGSEERSGRVRGMGLGPTPSQVFRVHVRSHHGCTRSTDPSYLELQNELARMRKAMDESEERNRRMEAKMLENDERNCRMEATIAMLLERFGGQLSSEQVGLQNNEPRIMAMKRADRNKFWSVSLFIYMTNCVGHFIDTT
ncbi:LOB domain-containing protein 18-like [Senna tora]|uniref:LOB domain-containing protein 18-like n=1 Tax=Senna tora TaxID=362788 RepID=A0A834U215_9FABA|nr:LOB domain-containing protein 18-like [Senna tora]